MLENLEMGIFVTIICMFIVFFVLALLIGVIKLQRVIIERLWNMGKRK